MRKGVSIRLSRWDRAQLERLIKDPSSERGEVRRAVALLATDAGLGTNAIVRVSGLSKPVVWRWQQRYASEGLLGLRPRRPGRPQKSGELAGILAETIAMQPP